MIIKVVDFYNYERETATIAMSFYDLFQGQCVQILMLSTIIAEHTKVCHLPGSKIACVNVHKLSSISEKNKI